MSFDVFSLGNDDETSPSIKGVKVNFFTLLFQ